MSGNTVVSLYHQSAPPRRDIDLPAHKQVNQLVGRALQSLREVLTVPIMGNAGIMRQRLEASRYVLDLARAVAPACLSVPQRGKARAKARHLADLDAQIEELKLEAAKVQAEASVTALKKRARQ